MLSRSGLATPGVENCRARGKSADCLLHPPPIAGVTPERPRTLAADSDSALRLAFQVLQELREAGLAPQIGE